MKHQCDEKRDHALLEWYERGFDIRTIAEQLTKAGHASNCQDVRRRLKELTNA